MPAVVEKSWRFSVVEMLVELSGGPVESVDTGHVVV